MREKILAGINHIFDFFERQKPKLKSKLQLLKQRLNKKSTPWIFIDALSWIFIGALLFVYAINWFACMRPTGIVDSSDIDICSNSDQTEVLVTLANANTVGNTSFNLLAPPYSGASFAYQDGWLYYAFDNCGIRRIPDGGRESEIQILSQDEGSYLNVVGEWLYYITSCDDSYSADNTYVIKRIKIDGSAEEIIINNLYDCTNPVWVGNGYIFYNNSDSNGNNYVYRTGLDGSNPQQIARGILTSVNFYTSSILVEDQFDSTHYTAYTFEGGRTSEYSFFIEAAEDAEEDDLYIKMFDIPNSQNYILGAKQDSNLMWNSLPDIGYIYLINSSNYFYQPTTYVGNLDVKYIVYENNKLYYIGAPIDVSGSDIKIDDSQIGIHNYTLDGTDTLLVRDSEISHMFIPGDGWIYYYSDFVWFRYSLDGGRTEYISWMLN